MACSGVDVSSSGKRCAACAKGKRPNTQRSSCEECPAGQYFSAAKLVCMSCSAGDEIGANKSTCVPCGAGMQSTTKSPRCARCDVGKEPAPSRVGCLDCQGGSASQNGLKCVKCTGAKQPNKAKSACVPCPAGEVPNTDRSACTACPAKTVASGANCSDCARDTVPNEAQTACTPCPVGRAWTTGTDCQPRVTLFAKNVHCAPARGDVAHSWLDGKASNTGGKSCDDLSGCMECIHEQNTINITAGWHLHMIGGVASVLKCPGDDDACLSTSWDASSLHTGRAFNKTTGCNAARGFEGLLCAQCSARTHYRNGAHRCASCDAVAEAAGSTFAVLLVLFVGGLAVKRVVAVRARYRNKAYVPAATAETIDLSRASRDLDPAAEEATRYLNPLESDAIPPDGAAPEGWCSQISGLAALFLQRLAYISVRIILSMLQVLAVLDLAVAKPLREFASVLNFEIGAQIYHFECHGLEHSYYRAWLVSGLRELSGLQGPAIDVIDLVLRCDPPPVGPRWLNTVGTLALLLLLVVLWYVLLRCTRDAEAARSEAASLVFVVVFLWYRTPI